MDSNGKDMEKTEQITTGSNDLHTGETIRTFKGHYINVFNPRQEDIDIEDIAHALSHVCRFGGHTPEFYSVAQHSLEVMWLVPDELKLEALLHDASEAYMCDMPRPIKRNMPEYKSVENNLMKSIAEKFDLKWPMPKEIKMADNKILEQEHHNIILKKDLSNVMAPRMAKVEFLLAFEKLIQ